MCVRPAFLVLLGLLLTACSAGEDTRVVERQVEQFHQRLDAGEINAIITAMHPKLVDAEGPEALYKFLNVVHTRLGLLNSTEKTGWQVNYSTDGTVITLTYKSTFARGQATESFVFLQAGEQFKLLSYNVNSKALILGESF